jgi:hypothetical protein
MMIIAAGAYIALTSNGGSNQAFLPPIDDGGDDNNTSDGTTLPLGNDTVLVPFPVEQPAGEASVALQLTYPGQGQGGDYNYTWSEPYGFRLVSSVLNGYQGRVLTKMFADKSGEIGTKCLIVTSGGSAPIPWLLNEKDGVNIISGDLGNWTSDGVVGNDLAFTVVFNRTGDFNITFQSFDLDTGRVLSAPLTIGPLAVPVNGTLKIDALGAGSFRTEENGTYYTVLLNVTNGWNVRYSVDAGSLVLSNGTAEVRANLSAMSFQDQSLAAGQSTQFLAYFDITGDVADLRLEYRDETSGRVIAVPLG